MENIQMRKLNNKKVIYKLLNHIMVQNQHNLKLCVVYNIVIL